MWNFVSWIVVLLFLYTRFKPVDLQFYSVQHTQASLPITCINCSMQLRNGSTVQQKQIYARKEYKIEYDFNWNQYQTIHILGIIFGWNILYVNGIPYYASDKHIPIGVRVIAILIWYSWYSLVSRVSVIFEVYVHIFRFLCESNNEFASGGQQTRFMTAWLRWDARRHARTFQSNTKHSLSNACRYSMNCLLSIGPFRRIHMEWNSIGRQTINWVDLTCLIQSLYDLFQNNLSLSD